MSSCLQRQCAVVRRRSRLSTHALDVLRIQGIRDGQKNRREAHRFVVAGPSIEKGVVEAFSGSCRSGVMKGDTMETPDADTLEHL